MKIVIHSYSTPGNREKNEDTMEIINNLDKTNDILNNLLYISIFDGHGGGDISKILIDKINLSKYFCNNSSQISNKLTYHNSYNKKFIIPLFYRIQEKLKNYYKSSNKMGSTALLSIFYPKSDNKLNLKVINLGDSRAILCNSNNIGIPLTLDHKPHLFCEKKRIINMGGSIELSDDDDPRINGMSVSRSFGDFDNKYIDQTPDIFDYVISSEKFIIMGCDGLWDVLNNQEVVDFVLEKYEEYIEDNKILFDLKSKSNNNIAQKLAEYAIYKKSTDNVSITIIFLIDNLC